MTTLREAGWLRAGARGDPHRCRFAVPLLDADDIRRAARGFVVLADDLEAIANGDAATFEKIVTARAAMRAAARRMQAR